MTSRRAESGDGANGTVPFRASVGLLLSGGLDSAILLGHLLAGRQRVQPFYVRSGLLWEKAELKAASLLVESMLPRGASSLIVLDMPLGDLYGDHWSLSGRNAPQAGTPSDAVYLPGRNALLAIKPAVWCAMHRIDALALAVLGSNPFADATPKFFSDFEAMLTQAAGRQVRLLRPFAKLQKKEVMELGRDLPLALTFSCIAPVGPLHCGACNKCEERQEAFLSAAIPDPTQYANANRLVTTTEGNG